jgi:hypothetical protein
MGEKDMVIAITVTAAAVKFLRILIIVSPRSTPCGV